jgi:hypothetical protein
MGGMVLIVVRNSFLNKSKLVRLSIHCRFVNSQYFHRPRMNPYEIFATKAQIHGILRPTGKFTRASL